MGKTAQPRGIMEDEAAKNAFKLALMEGNSEAIAHCKEVLKQLHPTWGAVA